MKEDNPSAAVPDSGPSQSVKFRASEVLCVEVLDHLPSDLARLCYFGSILDRTKDVYTDYARLTRFCPEEVDLANREAHQQVFLRLLRASLEDLCGQFAAWIKEEPDAFREWQEKRVYLELIPTATAESDRRVFEGNLAVALELIASQPPRSNERRKRNQK